MANPSRRQGENGDTSPAQNDQGAWDPFRLMREMFTWGSLPRAQGHADAAAGSPRNFEMTESTDAFVISADLPGVDEEDVEISLTGNRLTISGARARDPVIVSTCGNTSERVFGRFYALVLTLPEGTDRDQMQAEIANGVLTLTMAKRPEVQPKRINLGKRPGRGAQKS